MTTIFPLALFAAMAALCDAWACELGRVRWGSCCIRVQVPLRVHDVTAGFNFHTISVTSAHARFRVAGVSKTSGASLENSANDKMKMNLAHNQSHMKGCKP